MIFRNADIANLNVYLMNQYWNTILNVINLDDAVYTFYDQLYNAFNFFIPIKSSAPSKYPSWFTCELKRLVLSKKLAHQNYKCTNSVQDYLVFS